MDLDFVPAMGWQPRPEEVAAVLSMMAAQGLPTTFAGAAPMLMATAADDAPVFFWDAEKAIRGTIQRAWNQKSVGSCVGFGYGRAANDLMLWEIFSGEPEQYPGADVAPEVIYGGSRVEIGGGRIGVSDGSVGAWAAQFLREFGLVVRGNYGSIDLTEYSETLCRKLGSQGLSNSLEGVAKQHPVTAIAQVRNKDEGWAAIGAGKPVATCSVLGFSMRLGADGFCERSGRWGHCMETRGRFVHPERGRSVIKQNSWDDYLKSAGRKVRYVATDGSVKEFELPPGCFCVELDTEGEMYSEGDTFALAGLSGWKRTSPVSYEP